MGSQINGVHKQVGLLPAMKTNPKIIFFTDFDGTITMNDSMLLSHQLRSSGTECLLGSRQ